MNLISNSTNLYCPNTFPKGKESPGILNRFAGEVIIDDTEIEYHIDFHGYRNRNIAIGQNAAFGCSWTFGYGVASPWPELANLYNCGQNSASNDKIARLATNYIDQFSPDVVVIMWTFGPRRELAIPSDDSYEFFEVMAGKHGLDNKYMKAFIETHSDVGDQFNLDLNRTLVNYCCKANGTQLIELSVHEPLGMELAAEPPRARDDIHPGQGWHNSIAKLL